jgi:glycine/D-amino acid oxidase-like deaminating enzyme
MADDAEVHGLAVVGGGIMGLMTALLARDRHGDLDILLLDRSVLGMGATAYSAFLDLPFATTEVGRELSRRSRQLFGDLRERIPALPIEDLPFIGVCRNSARSQVLSGLTEPPRVWLERDIPGAPPGFTVPPDHVVFGGMVASRCTGAGPVGALVRALESSPRTRILEGANVARISSRGHLCELALNDGRVLRARRVALCLGPWLANAPTDVVSTGGDVRTKKVASLLIPGAPPPAAPVIYLFEHDAFFMPQPERQRWLFSFRSEDWDCGTDPSRLHLSPSDLERAQVVLRMHLPAVSPTALGARVFCDGYTASREPYISALPGMPAVALGGACGSGVRLAPGMAERGLKHLGLCA